VVAAATEGKFHVHAATTVDEALALVTGRTAGIRDADGHFPVGSVNGAVEARLVSFADGLDRPRFHDPTRPTDTVSPWKPQPSGF